jgi:cyclophilin family peptidyl-prolyl cis-trans isomerase/HEAT repeat protein
MTRVVTAVLSLVWLAAVPASAQPPSGAPRPAFEQKMAWILRLEDQRILRDTAVPQPLPVSAAARSKDRKSQLPPVVAMPAPDLVRLLEDPEGRVRRRAAQAIGRVGLPEGVPPLATVLAGDSDAEVRQMAAFALGLIGHKAAIDPLRAALRDTSALVQGRAAEALGLIGDAASAPAIATMAAAQLAQSTAARLDPDDLAFPQDPATEAFRLGVFALTRLKTSDALLSVVLDPSGQPRVRWWPVAYALSRTNDTRAVPALATLARAGGSISRAFAARGLGTHKDDASVATLLLLAQNWQNDSRAAVAAVRALGQIASPDAAPVLRGLLQARTTDPNIRLETVGALAALRDRESLDILIDVAGDSWPAIRAASLRAVQAIDPDTFLVLLSGLDPDPHASVRVALTSLLASLDAELAMPKLRALLAEKDAQVMPAAIAALMARVPRPPDLAATLLGLLAGRDVMVRAAAAAALGELKPAGAEQTLVDAYRAGRADDLYQARAAAVAALAKYGAAASLPTLKEALADKDWAIRLRAAALVQGFEPGTDVAAAIRPAPGRAVEAYAASSLVAPSVSPHVFLETDKGTIEIEVAVLDAPLTSENFLALARNGYFTGMALHRVVPNFVVQGGDVRGDGEGSPGYTIRDEINMLPYLRGTVGMALDGPDTGGSQFFITHSPQPHLDGKYTVFGRVVAGMDVVDRLQQWDVIRRVRTWDGVQLVTR